MICNPFGGCPDVTGQITEAIIALLPVFILLIIIFIGSFVLDWMYYKLFKKRLIKPWIIKDHLFEKF
ncbi:MAG: hypothetical protein ACW980_24710 [Promethearchaeota archaeon]|jgi:hypothetical protein